MPVFHVTLEAPNGNQVTGPIVARTAIDACTIMEIRHGIEDAQREGFTVRAEAAYDPDRTYEAHVLRMDARADAQ